MQDYAFLKSYFENAAAREAQGVEPLPVTADEARELTSLLVNPPEGADAVLLHLLKDRIPPGVDEAAKVKAEFLAEIAMGRQSSPLVSPEEAVNLLGTMKGGYNVAPLISLLSSPALAKAAREALTHTLMVYDAFDGVAKLCEAGNTEAQALMQAWADGTWFTSRESLPDTVTLKVFRVTGEINTDDLSPATDAWSRPDIPLHAMAMFKNAREGLTPDEEGVRGPITLINSLKEEGLWSLSVTWWVRALRVRAPLIPCSGTWAVISRACPTNARAVSFSAARLPPFSITLWRTAALCP